MAFSTSLVAKQARGVGRSAEYRRIAGLPRRLLSFDDVLDLTPVYLRTDSTCRGCELCRSRKGEPVTPRLRPIQSAALLEAEKARGLFAPIGVGHGKELICLLLADALQAKNAVILTKPRLKSQMLDIDIPRYGKHFKLPLGRFKVVSYTELSSADKGDVLERLDPDVVIANEAHALRHYHTSARGKKFWDWLKERDVPFCALSGTMANADPLDYAHLIYLALRFGSPYPTSYYEQEEWSRALAVVDRRADKQPMAPGALLDLCGPEARHEEIKKLSIDEQTILALNPLQSRERGLEKTLARRIYCRRLIETPGVVVSSNADDADCSLVISARPLVVPPEVTAVLTQLRKLWMIGGEELMEAMEVATKARQVSAGFYYYWNWPEGKADIEWLEARSAWHKEVRDAMRYRRGYYSPLMVRRAVEAGELESSAYDAWVEVEDRWKPHPPQATVWLSDFLVDDAMKWAAECTDAAPGIIWYEHDEIGERLRARGIETYGGGAEGDLIMYSTAKVVAASLRVHSDGKNLQRFCRNLVTTAPANGTMYEQFLGRTHRSGQRADEVTCDIYTHDISLTSAIAKATEQAHYVQETERRRQKLAYATRIGLDFNETEEVFAGNSPSANSNNATGKR